VAVPGGRRGCDDWVMGELILLRHGETEWSRAGRHTGRTDVPLTPRGMAGLGGPGVPGIDGGPAPKQDPDLWEWDYGGYEGITTAEIQRERPGWSLWADGVIPGDAEHPGETAAEVGERTDRVLKRAAALLPEGDVALVAHGHVLRVLTARWLGLPPTGGRFFRLDTGTISTLGTEHEQPVILTWNVPPST
jgi:broad specificity phosphatase PhoE